MRGAVEGQAVALGNAGLMETVGTVIDAAASARADVLRGQGATVVFLGVDGALAALIAVADRIKPSSRDAIRQLREAGLRIVMLTGDNATTAWTVAHALLIERPETLQYGN